jgi:hypothetical protein
VHPDCDGIDRLQYFAVSRETHPIWVSVCTVVWCWSYAMMTNRGRVVTSSERSPLYLHVSLSVIQCLTSSYRHCCEGLMKLRAGE